MKQKGNMQKFEREQGNPIEKLKGNKVGEKFEVQVYPHID